MRVVRVVLSKRRNKIGLLILIDIALITVAYMFSFYARFGYNLKEIQNYMEIHSTRLIVAGGIYIICFSLFKLYKSLWSFAGVDEVVSGTLAVFSGFVINMGISLFTEERIPRMVTILSGIMIFILCNGVRISYRVARRYYIQLGIEDKGEFKNILVIGAGTAGSVVQREYKRNLNQKKRVVAYIDDDCQKQGTYIGGVKVIGKRADIKAVVKKKQIDEIVIAIASLDKKNKREIIENCKESGVKVNIMPGLSEIIDGDFSINKIREVDVKDLLGRDEVKLDHTGISDYLENKVVLVTGGGGSIGSELCRQIVKFKPKELIILDIYENNAYDIQNELLRAYPNLKLKTLIASVRDKERLKSIYDEYKPNVVFHAAAHKHVPLMEESPMEAIKNNVLGTYNVAELAARNNIDKFVLISTDKAVNPTNVMGATKRMCEMIVQAFNKESKTEFVAVRFGNVLGSNGSVIPLFKKQIAEGGPITLTHKDITRYFMLIPEAAQLVLQAGAYAKGGEIFVLDMGSPVKIYDLACDLIKLSGLEVGRDINIEVTGLRPGEKLYEELLMSEEGLTETMHEKIFIGVPGDFNVVEVKKNIDELMRVARLNNKSMLRTLLGEVVPTYVRSDEDLAKEEAATTVHEV
ncbi:MAG: polysaccharide biosynthesis protein [Clostridium sp.]